MWFCGSSDVVKYLLSFPYLSPIVLRKELEDLMEQHGEECLDSSQLVDNHPVVFWNLVSIICFNYSFSKHLIGICILASSRLYSIVCMCINF